MRLILDREHIQDSKGTLFTGRANDYRIVRSNLVIWYGHVLVPSLHIVERPKP